VNGAAETPDPSAQGSGATLRAKFRPSRALMASVKKPASPAPSPRRTRSERLARQLALAHWIDQGFVLALRLDPPMVGAHDSPVEGVAQHRSKLLEADGTALLRGEP